MMVRRSKRAAYFKSGAPLPEGWIEHDGSGLPIGSDEQPAVMFRMGTKTRGGSAPASHWGDMWTWDADARPEPMVIVAYKL